jgi:Rod binding domain-containing protein
MIPSDLPIQPLQTPLPSRADIRANASSADSDALKSVAQHSGLSEAMTSGEGKMASAFGSFYLEQLANQMAADGGFGMADSIYKQLEQYATDPEIGSSDISIAQEDKS